MNLPAPGGMGTGQIDGAPVSRTNFFEGKKKKSLTLCREALGSGLLGVVGFGLSGSLRKDAEGEF